MKLVRYRPALHQNKQCVRLVCHGPVLRLSKTRVRPVCRRPVRQRIRHIQEVRRVTAGTIHGTGMTIVTSGLTSGRTVTMATDGFMAGTSTTTAMTGRMLGESVMLALCVNTMMTTRQMRGASANLMMSGVRVTGKRAVGARAIGRRADGTMQTSAATIANDRTDAVKSFIFRGKEHEPVDQLSLQGQ